jgi:KH domain-containing protein
VTDDSAFKKQVRIRMTETGENYTVARRAVIAGRDAGQPPAALRIYLSPHVDLPLTDEAARAYQAADEQGQRDMANRLLADHIELAGIGEAGIAAGSELETVQDLWIDEIANAVHGRIPRAAGIAAMAVSGDLDHVKVDIHARRPGLVHGHGHAEVDRLRAELEELTGKPVQLNILEARPEKGRKEIRIRPRDTAS